MAWVSYLISVLILTMLLTAFYSVLMALFYGLHENYRRYWQRAELQWTGPDSRALKQRALPVRGILLVALLSALLIVHLLFPTLY